MAMKTWLTTMEELKQHGDAFAEYLVERAEEYDKQERK
jgi:hypothetical protein